MASRNRKTANPREKLATRFSELGAGKTPGGVSCGRKRPRLKDTSENLRAWPAAAPDDFHASILTCELAQTDRHDIGFLKLVPFGRFTRRSRRTRRDLNNAST